MGRYTRNFDWVMAVVLAAIAAFGLFVLLTIDGSFFLQQFLYLIVGFVFLFFFSRLDRTLLWWLAPYGYILAVVLVMLPFFFPSIRGAHRWIVIGGQQVQPSELAKPLILLAFARFMAQRPPRAGQNVPLHVGLFLLPSFLIFRQPDLGTALVYASVWLVMLLASGVSIPLLMIGIGVVFTSFPLLWRMLVDYQKARILTFLNPALDPSGAGYNAIQAMIAVGSGQWFGRGLGRGTQSHLRFLPEYHTDFIFATIVEELGFIGGSLLLVFYAVLLWRIISPLVRGSISDLFHFVYAAGLFTMILTQLFVHAGMNMGIIPVTGITLPLASYGGSSILSMAMSVGLLWAFQADRRKDAVAIN